MIRIAIVEDEDKSAELLNNYITRYCQKTNRQFSCVRFENGLEFISDYKPIYDIVFMDIKMPHFDGMETSKELRKFDQNVALVFVTNLRQYAIRGYEVNALDYIVKPIEYYDFEMKMLKAIEYAQKYQTASAVINMGDIKKRILLRDLYYVEVRNHRLVYHAECGTYETQGQLNRLEEALQQKDFIKCDNSYLINLRHVMEVHANHIVVGQDDIPVSRRRKKDFMQALANYMGGGIS